MDERLHIKRGNGGDGEWRLSVVEQQLDEYIPRVVKTEEAVSHLVGRFDELVPKLTIAVESLTVAVAQWNTQRTVVTKLAGWTIGFLASIGATVIAAKLLGFF